MDFTGNKHGTISSSLRKKAVERAIKGGGDLPPVAAKALKGIEDWERGLITARFLEHEGGRKLISMGSLAHRGGKTHGLGENALQRSTRDGSGFSGSGTIDINTRLQRAKDDAAEIRAKSMDQASLNMAAERAIKIGYISPAQVHVLLDDIELEGGVAEYYSKAKKELTQAHKKRYDKAAWSRAASKIMAITMVIMAEGAEYPAKIATTMADKIFGARDIKISKDAEQRKAEMVFCGETALNMHHAAFEALLSGNSAKGVLIPEGYFEPLAVIPAIYDGDIQVVPTHDNGYKLKAERLEEILNKAPKGSIAALLMTIPCNPLGLEYSKDELEAIGKVAVKHGLKIIVDEQFAGLYHDKKQKSVSMASLTVDVDGKPHDLYKHTLTIQGTTKLFDHERNKSGIACSGDTEWIRKIKDIIKRDVTGLTRHEVIETGFAIDNTNLQKNSERLGRQFERLQKAIDHANKIAGENVFSLLVKPDSGYFTVLTIPRELGLKALIPNHEAFFLYTMLQAGVEGRSIEGMGFDSTDKLGMRINFSHVRNDNDLEKDDMFQAFTRLGQMAKDIKEGKAPTLVEVMRHSLSKVVKNDPVRE